jgi:excinuclease ABC subunit B
LRSATALIQTFGRAARNVNGRAILYAETVTNSMKAALAETTRRRRLQEEFNRANGITPQSIIKRIDEVLTSVYERDYMDYTRVAEDEEIYLSPQKRKQKIDQLEKSMREAAKNLEFEKAAKLRDEIARLNKFELELE